VSVEGPIVGTDPSDPDRDLRPLAHRYLGQAMGDRYMEETRGSVEQVDNVVVRMRPERWLTADYTKASRKV
jgi:hypothetical protein